ncbi:MAG: hypothetical protein ACI9EF_000611 [Pseudohongiellaceae bacterium]|jgi:hypothetical protein
MIHATTLLLATTLALLVQATSAPAQLRPGALQEPLEIAAQAGFLAGWVDTFGPEPGINGQILDMLVHDDGGGPALYVGGNFTSVNGVSASRLARWDGAAFSDVGRGLNNIVWSLAEYDSGSGPELMVGGLIQTAGGSVPVSGVAAWDGSNWSAPFLISASGVEEMVVGDLGSGPVLLLRARTLSMT